MDAAAADLRLHLRDAVPLLLRQTLLNKLCGTDEKIHCISHIIAEVSAKNLTCETEREPLHGNAAMQHVGCFRKPICAQEEASIHKKHRRKSYCVCIPSLFIY